MACIDTVILECEPSPVQELPSELTGAVILGFKPEPVKRNLFDYIGLLDLERADLYNASMTGGGEDLFLHIESTPEGDLTNDLEISRWLKERIMFFNDNDVYKDALKKLVSNSIEEQRRALEPKPEKIEIPRISANILSAGTDTDQLDIVDVLEYDYDPSYTDSVPGYSKAMEVKEYFLIRALEEARNEGLIPEVTYDGREWHVDDVIISIALQQEAETPKLERERLLALERFVRYRISQEEDLEQKVEPPESDYTIKIGEKMDNVIINWDNLPYAYGPNHAMRPIGVLAEMADLNKQEREHLLGHIDWEGKEPSLDAKIDSTAFFGWLGSHYLHKSLANFQIRMLGIMKRAQLRRDPDLTRIDIDYFSQDFREEGKETEKTLEEWAVFCGLPENYFQKEIEQPQRYLAMLVTEEVGGERQANAVAIYSYLLQQRREPEEEQTRLKAKQKFMEEIVIDRRGDDYEAILDAKRPKGFHENTPLEDIVGQETSKKPKGTRRAALQTYHSPPSSSVPSREPKTRSRVYKGTPVTRILLHGEDRELCDAYERAFEGIYEEACSMSEMALRILDSGFAVPSEYMTFEVDSDGADKCPQCYYDTVKKQLKTEGRIICRHAVDYLDEVKRTPVNIQSNRQGMSVRKNGHANMRTLYRAPNGKILTTSKLLRFAEGLEPWEVSVIPAYIAIKKAIDETNIYVMNEKDAFTRIAGVLSATTLGETSRVDEDDLDLTVNFFGALRELTTLSNPNSHVNQDYVVQ